MKNQRGVNLVSLSIAVIVIITIVGTVLYNVRTNLRVQKLKAMQSDIENLRGKVANYYLQYGALPVLNTYNGEDTHISDGEIQNIRSQAANNNLDTGEYYIIDLSAMENLTLTYGKDYEKIQKLTSAESIKNLNNGKLTDIYIINSVSHNIFYVAGIKYEDKNYYTQYQDEEKNKIGLTNVEIDTNVEKKNRKVLTKIEKGETAPNNRNAIYIDEKGHEAIIPAGFTVSNEPGESSVESGLVIRDNKGNEFVWIPVGIAKQSAPAQNIILSRYTFNESGLPNVQENNIITTTYTELSNSSYGNAVSKVDVSSINGFIARTNEAGGFWIGRYEAGIEGYVGNISQTNNNQDISWTGYTQGNLVEKPNSQVFNYITQNKASELCRKMYSNANFESDLINSFAWDTATLFLQEYDNRSNNSTVYSRQTSLNSGNISNTGTSDKICNVFDLASNCCEWTTETNTENNSSCVKRGDDFESSIFYTCSRSSKSNSYADASISFRPILYIK